MDLTDVLHRDMVARQGDEMVATKVVEEGHMERRQQARDPSTPVEELDALAKHSSCQYQDAVAWNPSASVETLDWLVSNYGPDGNTMAGVASHPRVTAEMLVGLSRHRDGPTRGVVARRADTPVVVLRRMVYDPAVYVAQAAILNPSLPLGDVIGLRESGLVGDVDILRAALDERLDREGVVGLLGLMEMGGH